MTIWHLGHRQRDLLWKLGVATHGSQIEGGIAMEILGEEDRNKIIRGEAKGRRLFARVVRSARRTTVDG